MSVLDTPYTFISFPVIVVNLQSDEYRPEAGPDIVDIGDVARALYALVMHNLQIRGEVEIPAAALLWLEMFPPDLEDDGETY